LRGQAPHCDVNWVPGEKQFCATTGVFKAEAAA
jgi:hypothetical protein